MLLFQSLLGHAEESDDALALDMFFQKGRQENLMHCRKGFVENQMQNLPGRGREQVSQRLLLCFGKVDPSEGSDRSNQRMCEEGSRTILSDNEGLALEHLGFGEGKLQPGVGRVDELFLFGLLFDLHLWSNLKNVQMKGVLIVSISFKQNS